MSVFITDQYEPEKKDYPLSMEELSGIVETVVEAACEEVSCPYLCEVDVTFVDDETIHGINRETRNIDRATDVLSFPLLEYPEPGSFAFLEEQDPESFDPDSFDPDTGELMLGDIVLSLDHALAQAEEYGHGLRREVAFLTAHSMLHLFGYDHEDEAGQKLMEELQEKILSRKGFTR